MEEEQTANTATFDVLIAAISEKLSTAENMHLFAENIVRMYTKSSE